MDNISSEKLSVNKDIEKSGLADKTYKDRDVAVDTKGNNLDRELKESHKRDYRFFLKKYFAISCLFSELGKINNRGVEYALKGRFKEAEILFKEVLTEEKNFAAAFNNLGIIYELFGYYNAAFNMYSRACLLEPENRYFRRNFLYFRRLRRD